jgi:hypothetical protein
MAPQAVSYVRVASEILCVTEVTPGDFNECAPMPRFSAFSKPARAATTCCGLW